MSAHLEFLLLGLGSGAAFALLGLGLVLEFRSSGVINFAHGAIAMFVAFTFVRLQSTGQLLLPVVLLPDHITVGRLAAWPAAFVSIAYAGALGALVYYLIFKRLQQSPPLAKLVASVGLAVYLESAIVLNLGADAFGVAIQTGGSLLPSDPVSLAGAHIPANRLWLFGVTVACGIALWAVYRFTRFGLATRAAAESEEGVAVLGYSASTLGVSNWVIASMLAGLAGILIAPISGLNPSIFTLLVVPALGAALIGKLSSFSITLIAGLALGMFQSDLTKLQLDYSWLPQQGLKEGLPFLIIILALVVFGRKLPLRGSLNEPPPPRASRPTHLPVSMALGVGATLIGLFTLPSVFRLGLLQTEIEVLLVLSLVVLTGYCGQISMTQMAFAGAGGFFTSIAGETWGLPFPLPLLLGALVAAGFGLLVALPALRSRGLHLAVLTLATAVAFDSYFFQNQDLNGGIEGRNVPRPSLFGLDLGVGGTSGSAYPRPIFGVLVLVFVALGVWLVANLRRSATGRHMLAIRSREGAASAAGIGVGPTKLFAWTLAAFIAGIAGSLIGYQNSAVSSDQFGIFMSLSIITLAYIGGVGRISGAVVAAIMFAPGGLWVVAGDQLIPGLDRYALLLGGFTLILVTIMNPDGVAADFGRLLNQLGAALARKLGRAPSARAEQPPAPELAPIAVGADPPATGTPPTGDPLLTVRDLTVQFGGVVAVDDISLVAHPGRVVGLIGPNGAGKTTTIDAITGFNDPRAGEIAFDGASIAGRSSGERNRLGIARTFQALELFEDLTVEENLLVAAERRSVGGRLLDLLAPFRSGPGRETAADVMERLGLAPIKDRLASDLSTAQRKRVAIGRALASRPRLVLLDEPAAGLDATEGEELGKLLRALTADGTAILIIDHDVGLMFNICDYIYVLDFGKLIAEGTANEIRRDERVIAAYLGAEADGEAPEAATRARALAVDGEEVS